MELRQLEYFVAVAEELNFSRAADRLTVGQSAVSTTISGLERELATRLLDRTSRRVELTQAGLALLPKARATLAAARDALEAVDDVSGGIRGVLRVGTMILGTVDLSALLGHFHDEHPAVAIHLATAASGGAPGLIRSLVDGELDVAFVSVAGNAPPGARLTRLQSTPLELVVPGDHPLADQPVVDISELSGQSFIDFPGGYGNRVTTDQAFNAAGLARHVAVEIVAFEAAADYVRHRLGIALLPRGVVGAGDGLVMLEVTGADLIWSVSLATPASRRPTAATRAFVKLVESQLSVDTSEVIPGAAARR
jgi:DNA-binding transcriptional LysR family regulator